MYAVGLGAVGAAGYYFYRAGGDPKLAEKRLERDATSAARSLNDKLPAPATEAKKDAEVGQRRVESAIDSAARSAKSSVQSVSDASGRLAADADQAARDAQVKLRGAVDKADRKVLETADEANRTVKGWFGRGGK